MSEAAAETRRARPLRVAEIAFAAIALTLGLMILRFPYDRLVLAIAQRLEKETGAHMAWGRVSLSLVRWAPGLAAADVQIARPDGTRLERDRIAVRPAIALAWLRGVPALATEVRSARFGGGSGVVTFGNAPGFVGTLHDVDLEQLPQQRLGAPLSVKGRADADVHLSLGEGGPEGEVEFEARDGMLTHPSLPFPMQFQKLTGELEFGGDSWAEIRKLELASRLATGHGKGTIGRAPAFAAAPLHLEIELTASGAVQGSLRSLGVAIGNDGQIHLDVSGTPARPLVR